jgi:hypothetical protein
MKAFIGGAVARFAAGRRSWLPGWARPAPESGSPEAELQALPPPLRTRLHQAITRLPAPQASRTAISEALEEGLRTWRQQPQAGNALVILANPLEPLERYLTDTLSGDVLSPDGDLGGCRLVVPLPVAPRRADPLSTAEQVREAFRSLPEPPADGAEGGAEGGGTTTLVLIPALEMLVLRCIGGWESVELLRAELVKRPDLFWVIGCNRWAWRFLDAVVQAEACFGEPVGLPRLQGDDLKSWLLALDGLPEALEQGTEDEDWQELADLAKGVGSIAARLWLDGLCVADDTGITATVPALRSLPALLGLDRHLLHGVLIHGRVSRAHLCRSLGESEGRMDARSQWLLRQGILELQQGVLSVSPLYYRHIASELANNNFFVESDG